MNTEQSIELALKDYDTAISMSPYTAKFYHAKGLAKQALIASIENRLKREFYGTLDKLRARKRNRSKSRERKQQKEESIVPVAWQTLAQAANEKHQFDSIYNFQKALDLNDKFVESRYHLAIVLFKSGQVADAIKQMSKVAEAKKDDKQVWLERG
jgi:tetratricopeptide (TPR) repeat protein